VSPDVSGLVISLLHAGAIAGAALHCQKNSRGESLALASGLSNSPRRGVEQFFRALLGEREPKAMAGRKPNILFLMVDQMTPGVMPAYGHKTVKAPVLTRLAERAVVFDSAYCASPLCAPARFTMMSGRLPSAIEAYDNASDFPADTPTLAHYLRASGYLTVLAGKMHFCGPDQLHGFEQRLTTDIYPADYGWTPDWENFEQRTGWYHDMNSVAKAGPCLRSNQLDYDDEVGVEARRWLYDRARGSDERPFFLCASFIHPHDPYIIRPEFYDLYADDDIEMPRVEIDPADLDPHSKRLRHVCDMDAVEIGQDQVRRARRAYYGAVSYIDRQIGGVLSALEEVGQAEDTIIVFTGDHGDMLGERGLWYKMSWFEPSSRVPLMVYAPKLFQPRRVAESVSLIDLLPTLAELAEDGQAPAYATPLDGHSLLPHCAGTGGHDEVIGEYYGEGALAPLLMIRRGRWKFITSLTDPDQLYDIQADPDERENLAEAPAHGETLAGFRAEAAERWDQEALRGRVLESQRRRLLVYEASRQGRPSTWDYQPYRDASRSYTRTHRDFGATEDAARWPPVEE
jgi:choline-sulfatase